MWSVDCIARTGLYRWPPSVDRHVTTVVITTTCRCRCRCPFWHVKQDQSTIWNAYTDGPDRNLVSDFGGVSRWMFWKRRCIDLDDRWCMKESSGRGRGRRGGGNSGNKAVRSPSFDSGIEVSIDASWQACSTSLLLLLGAIYQAFFFLSFPSVVIFFGH